jgi:hypothetical protein
MAGLRLTLPTSFTDTTLTKLQDDPVLAAGSLMLIEPNHPVYPWAAGVPAAADSAGAGGLWLPNAAQSMAKTLLGSSIDSAIGAKLVVGSNWVEGSGANQSGISERTTKGGFHTISSRLRAPANNYKRFYAGSAFGAYMASNASHSFYVSMWKKHTRTEAPFGPQYPIYAGFRNVTGTVTTAIGTFMAGGSNPNSGTTVIGFENVNGTLNLNENSKLAVTTLNNGGSNAAAVTNPDPASTWTFGPSWGGYSAYPEASPYPNNSMVVYRWYVEDLTVSGRTYAQAKAVDDAEFTKQVLTVGGRYYQDTHTDPATIP